MAKNSLPNQNRESPAYQEFAASMMARLDYRQLSLAERGLLYSLRHEIWVNRTIPADPAILARLLGYDASDVEAALPALIPAFFQVVDGALTCLELEDYRKYQDARRTAMSEGGKKSADVRKSKTPKHLTKEPASTLNELSKHLTKEPASLKTSQDQTSQDQNPLPGRKVSLTHGSESKQCMRASGECQADGDLGGEDALWT